MQVLPKSISQKNLVVVSRVEKHVPYFGFYFWLHKTSARTSTHLGHPLMCFIWKLCNFGTDVSLAPISMFTFRYGIFASWEDSSAMLFHTLVERSCSVSSNQNHEFSQLGFCLLSLSFLHRFWRLCLLATICHVTGSLLVLIMADGGLALEWFYSRVWQDKGNSMFTFKWNMLMPGWVLYVVRSITLCTSEACKSPQDCFHGLLHDFPISHYYQFLASFHEALKYNVGFTFCWIPKT